MRVANSGDKGLEVSVHMCLCHNIIVIETGMRWGFDSVPRPAPFGLVFRIEG